MDFPSPKEVLVNIVKGLTGGPVQDAFHTKDLAGILPMFGDDNGDGTVDVRFIPFVRAVPGDHVIALDAIGPFNIPITEAMRHLAQLTKLAPVTARPLLGGAVGTVATTCGLIEKALVG